MIYRWRADGLHMTDRRFTDDGRTLDFTDEQFTEDPQTNFYSKQGDILREGTAEYIYKKMNGQITGWLTQFKKHRKPAHLQ